jgi:hypothetical protein
MFCIAFRQYSKFPKNLNSDFNQIAAIHLATKHMGSAKGIERKKRRTNGKTQLAANKI